MAASGEIIIINISSDEEDDHNHSSIIKRRVKKESNIPTVVSKDLDEDCIILDDDPDKSLRFEIQSGHGESDEPLIVAEKGQVACRDYPHARHLCARFPFNTNPHNKYCDMCHCYVCDTHAPCVYWGSGDTKYDHCHSTDKEEVWRTLREYSKKGTLKRVYEWYSQSLITYRISQLQIINEDTVVLSGLGKLCGTVKWFNRTRGFGFIIPDNGEEELFVHHSSIKSEGFRVLIAEGEAVEFDVGNGEDGRKTAINVTGPGGTFVGTTITTVSSSVVSACNGGYNCREVRRFARNCSSTGSSSNGPETSDTTECADLGIELASAEKLTGIVKWYNKQRGFGTITPDNGGKDLFVKKSSINKGYRTLVEGELVEFQIGSGGDGRRMAINVGEVTECDSCRGKGHLARNCPQKVCHQCNKPGHLEKDCNENECYRCGENGHFGSECPRLVCNKCGEQGHLYTECTQKVCDKCHEKGHLGSDCHRRSCWRCSKKGHPASECPQFVCYKCNEQGHFSRYCTEKWCHRCKQKGHTDNNCPRFVCYRCKEPGHLAKDCTGKACPICNEKGHAGKNCPLIVCNRCKEPGHCAMDCCPEKVCQRCGVKGCSDKDSTQNMCYICEFAPILAIARI